MACFLVPVAEAIVTTTLTRAMEAEEKKKEMTGIQTEEKEVKMPFSRKMKWLNKLLWGGSALLAFEHLWHGEIVPWAPFITAAENSSDMAIMLHEISTVGVTMAVMVTAVWGGMVLVTRSIEKSYSWKLTKKHEI